MSEHILFIITDTRTGGTEKSLISFLEALDRKQYKPFCLFLKPGGELQEKIESLCEKTCPFSPKSLFDFSFIRKVCRFVLQEKIVILHSFLFHSNMLSRIVKCFHRSVVVINSHRTMEKGKKWHLLCDALTKNLVDFEVANAAAVNEFYQNKTSSHPDKIKTIYNGYPRFSNSRHCTKKIRRFVVVASFSKAKGQRELIQTLSTFLLDKPYSVTFVGEGALRPACENLVLSLGLTERISFRNRIDDQTALYDLCDCLLIPSLWEGMPNVLFEALLREKPVISTAVGGVQELSPYAHNSLFIFDHDNPQSLESSMDNIISNWEKIKEDLKQAREGIERDFSVATMAKKYQSLYSDLLQKTKNSQKSIPQAF